MHTAHEGGWWNILLGRAVDLRWLIDPGSVQSALITGMFGIQPEPTWGEVIAFLALRGAHDDLRLPADAPTGAGRDPACPGRGDRRNRLINALPGGIY